MTINQKKYKSLQDELSTLRLTVETLSNRKLMHEIQRGIEQIQSKHYSRVRDDLKI